MDLIFSNNEALNVDLRALPRNELLTISQDAGQVMLEGIRHDAERQRDEHVKDQIRVFIKKNLQPVATELLQMDSGKSNTVDREDLLGVIQRRVRLP